MRAFRSIPCARPAALAFLGALIGLASAVAAGSSRHPNRVDCTAKASACPAITVAGDPPAADADGQPAAVSGYADASLRSAASGKRLWMTYSWIHHAAWPGAGAVSVDSHLARSDDGGTTWRFVRELWPAVPAVDPNTGKPASYNSEAPSLEARGKGPNAVWYTARERYVSGARGPDLDTFEIRIARASSPQRLPGAAEASLGGDVDLPGYVDVDLSSLSKELGGCTFNDPGLHYERPHLYLAAECLRFSKDGSRDFARDFIALFRARPQGPVGTWSWRYAGKLAGHAAAEKLGGDGLEQADLRTTPNGGMVLIASPSGPGGRILDSHFGCRAVRVASLDPPQLARRPSGSLKVLASVTASDLAPNGPGSCGYDPGSATGIVIARRVIGPGLTGTLNASDARP